MGRKQVSFIERCPLFRVSVKREFTVYRTLVSKL